MYKIVLSFLIFLSLDASAQRNDDSVSKAFADRVNAEVEQELAKLPSVMKIRAYKDGKIMKRGYKVYAYKTGMQDSFLASGRRTLNLKLTPSEALSDSIYFIVTRHGDTVRSSKFVSQRFLHGGRITLGFISDYDKERAKYIQDDSKYFYANLENELYDLLLFIKKANRDRLDPCRVGYVVTRWNSVGWVKYDYQFKPLRR